MRLLLVLFLVQAGACLQWGVSRRRSTHPALTRLGAQKRERVHLQAAEEQKEEKEGEDDDEGGEETKSLSVITEFRDKLTNATLVACQGSLNTSSPKRLELFGLYQQGVNFTSDQNVELVERVFDLRKEQSITELLALWRSERLLSNSKEFPPSVPHVDGPHFLNEIQDFEQKLFRLGKRVNDWKRLEDAGSEDESEAAERMAIKGFLDRTDWPRNLALARADDNATLEKESIKAFLEFFRQEFPYYYSACLSPGCGCKDGNAHLGVVFPKQDEHLLGKAAVCELVLCNSCTEISRFPRLNALAKVLDTRRGRCGEYSVLALRMFETLGYKARWVVDWADHVWVEISMRGRWVHVDPCEASIDEPLLYEGWGKNATFVFAFGKDGSVEDVTSSYTTHDQGLIERRRVSRGVNSSQVQRALHRTKDMWV